MRIVALEEHYTVPAIVSRIDPAAIRRRGFPAPDIVWGQTLKRNELAQLGDARIADMDASGITLQVLSVAGPGADVVPGADGIALARDYNNALFEATSHHPDRYQGFAHLPMHSPDAAADELERTVKDLGFRGLLVNGPTDGRFLDDPLFEPILARAEALSVPIYIHPGIPSEKVREAHFDRLQLCAGRIILGLAYGDSDPCATAGSEWGSRSPSSSPDRHRTLGRGDTVHAGPHRRNDRR
jgi:uncharacterized protein